MERLEILKNRIDELLGQKQQVLVAIDGKCTSGKTTLARQLAESYDCNVFHMDEFFLRPEQRVPERFAEVGGNVDYERFLEEVLLPLKTGKPFSYRPFQCATFTMAAPVAVTPKKLNIVEGTYSLHPHFANPYDLTVLLTVEPETQHQRILQRPQRVHKPFFELWIPMENAYLEALAVHADIIL